jgi:hypothetical protein
MKLSILLRGNTFIAKDRFGFSMDARHNAVSLKEQLINPIREIYPGAKLYLVTYDSPVLAEVSELLQPCELILLDAAGSSQLDSFKRGLTHVFDHDDFDALVATRFDVEFLKPFNQWGIDINQSTIYFPFKETSAGWRNSRTVGDTVHVIGRKSFTAFHRALLMAELARRKDMHLLYYFLRTMTAELGFIQDGYWDSNTMWADPECDNPLYKIFYRKMSRRSPLRDTWMPEALSE